MPRVASAQPAPASKGSVYSGSMMNTLPTANGWFDQGNASCVPYTVIASSSGWVTSASQMASHQRRHCARLAMQPGDAGGQRQREQRQPERRVRLGTVQHHVADRVAVVDEHVEIGQRAGHRAPQRRLPHRRAAAHRGHADGGTQGDLRERVHGVHRPAPRAARPPAPKNRHAFAGTPSNEWKPAVDLKLPITIISELSEGEVRATGELDLASGEIPEGA